MARTLLHASRLLSSAGITVRRTLPEEWQHSNPLPTSCATPMDTAQPMPKVSSEVLGSSLSGLITNHPYSQAWVTLTPGAGDDVIFLPNPYGP